MKNVQWTSEKQKKKQWKTIKINKEKEQWISKCYKCSSPTRLILTLNVNSINTSIKGQRLSHWIQNMTQLYVDYKKPILNMA